MKTPEAPPRRGRLRRVLLGCAAVLIATVGVGLLGVRWYQVASRELSFFEDDIAAFEAADAQRPPSPGEVVFYGSSSLRFWGTLAPDFAPLEVVNRGFGGAHMSHLAHFAPRVFAARQPRAVVIYAGDNDLSDGGARSAEQVLGDCQRLLQVLHARAPQARIYLLSIKPSPLRWSRWPEVQRANTSLKDLAGRDPRVRYVDLAEPLLDEGGEPRGECYRIDGLHLNARGYAAWTGVLRPILLAELYSTESR